MKIMGKKDNVGKVYRGKAKKEKQQSEIKTEFPSEFPFWARLKISKNRTTLVIDDTQIVDKKSKKTEEAFVHRESTHSKKKDYEEIKPNPDKSDSKPMYLKRPTKLPKRMFKPHNKKLDMPKHLKERYEKNNRDKK